MLSAGGSHEDTGALREHWPTKSTAKVKAAGRRAVEAETVCKGGRAK